MPARPKKHSNIGAEHYNILEYSEMDMDHRSQITNCEIITVSVDRCHHLFMWFYGNSKLQHIVTHS